MNIAFVLYCAYTNIPFVSMIPVPYTHLDVYKRQGFFHPEGTHSAQPLGTTIGMFVHIAVIYV